MRVPFKSVLVCLVFQAATAFASDPMGIYALIDRVVAEPAEGTPERVQVWGAFCLAEGKRGGKYTDPVWGYMYFGLAGDDKDETRRVEWKDLGTVAGTGQGVAFGWRYDENVGTVRAASESPADPDVHPLGHGVQRIRGYGTPSPGTKMLRLPRPEAPVESTSVSDARPVLTARNPRDAADAKLVFELDLGDGNKIVSPALAQGEGTTTWQVPLSLPAGSYTWDVHSVGTDWEGTRAGSSFTIATGSPAGEDGAEKSPSTRPSR